MVHLVYCDNQGKHGAHLIDKIISGEKTMVVRGAVGRKIPHSRVFSGETLYFMEKGTTDIRVKAIVTNVENYVKLDDAEIDAVLEKNNSKLCLNEKMLARWHKKCLCLVEFSEVELLEESLQFEKQANMDDWLILEKIDDVLAGTSIKYNYDNARFK